MVNDLNSADPAAERASQNGSDVCVRLSADRTLLAAERTYAAWMRTGLASLAAGLGARTLLHDIVHPLIALAAAIVLIVFAEFCFVCGVWRELTRNTGSLDPDTPRLPAWLLIAINGLLMVLGVAALIGVLIR